MRAESKVAADVTQRPAIHLHPTAPLAERVLLPGDPGRALALAQALLSEPRMFNHNRGLWGYTGAAADGEPLTIQATGMGGPSAAIVLSELIALGAAPRDPRRHLRRARAGARRSASCVIAREAICADGTSRALGAGERVARRPRAHATRSRAAPPARARARSSASTCSTSGEPRERAARDGALAVEMEAATLFALGAARRRAGRLRAGRVRHVRRARRAHADRRRRRCWRRAEAMGAAALAALAR